MKHGSKVPIIIEIPREKAAYDNRVDGIAVVTATRKDGCYTLHLPSQHINVDSNGNVVDEWPKHEHKSEAGEVGVTTETFTVFPELLVVDKPLKAHGK